jgi:hypothetical protein
MAAAWEVRPAALQQALALEQLAPEIAAEIRAGKRRIDDDVRRAVWEAFLGVRRAKAMRAA